LHALGALPAVDGETSGRVHNAPKSGGSDTGSKSGALSDSSEREGQELMYEARVSLDKTRMQVDDKLVNLAPEMAVTVEVRTGKRRIIQYLMSPLLRYRQDSLRER
jgi:hemolysin D